MRIMPHGWMGRDTTLGRPRARLLALLALLWLPLATIGGTLLWTLEHGGRENSTLTLLTWAVVLVEPLLVAASLWWSFREPPRPVRKIIEWDRSGPLIH